MEMVVTIEVAICVVQASPQTVITGEGRAATHGNRMKELLARLRALLTEFEAEG